MDAQLSECLCLWGGGHKLFMYADEIRVQEGRQQMMQSVKDEGIPLVQWVHLDPL